MLKASGFVLTSGLMLGGAGLAGGQMFPPVGGLGMPAGQMPPEMAEMQKAQERLMKDAAPEWYAVNKKLRDIEAKLGEIAASLAKKDIDKETAKENMLPLIKERQEIQNDPDFLVEQRLAEVYFSSSEYQAKMEKIMRAFAEKQKRKARR